MAKLTAVAQEAMLNAITGTNTSGGYIGQTGVTYSIPVTTNNSEVLAEIRALRDEVKTLTRTVDDLIFGLNKRDE